MTAPTAEPPEPSPSAASTPSATSDAAGSERAQPRRWRRVVAVVLVILAALLAPLSVTAVWLHERVLDTDGYVDTVAPLAENETVTDALAKRIVDELFEVTDLQRRITDSLPGRTEVLGPTLAGSLRGVAIAQTERILESDAFEQLWIRANRAAHEQVVAMFTGEGDAVSEIDDDRIVLDLGAVADRVRQRLVDLGVSVLDRVRIPESTIEVTLLEADFVTWFQPAFDALNTLSTVLPIAFVVVVVGAIAVAPRRRGVLVALGLSAAATTALLLVGLDLGRRVTVDEASSASLDADATKAVYDTLVVALRDWSWYVVAVGLLVAAVALVSNPGWIGRLLRRVRRADADAPSAAATVRAHRGAVLAAVAGAGLLVLVAWPTPTFLVVAVVVLLTALALAVVVAMARWAPTSAAGESAAPVAPTAPGAAAAPTATEPAGPAKGVDDGG